MFTSNCVVAHLQLCCVATSLYWATTTLATVGYGDITASNTGEQQYTIWIELMGTIAFGYMSGTLCSNVMNSKLQ